QERLAGRRSLHHQPEDVFLESDSRPVRWNPHDRLTTKLEYRTSMRNLGTALRPALSFLSDLCDRSSGNVSPPVRSRDESPRLSTKQSTTSSCDDSELRRSAWK